MSRAICIFELLCVSEAVCPYSYISPALTPVAVTKTNCTLLIVFCSQDDIHVKSEKVYNVADAKNYFIKQVAIRVVVGIFIILVISYRYRIYSTLFLISIYACMPSNRTIGKKIWISILL